jgi:hypothetical protein
MKTTSSDHLSIQSTISLAQQDDSPASSSFKLNVSHLESPHFRALVHVELHVELHVKLASQAACHISSLESSCRGEFSCHATSSLKDELSCHAKSSYNSS